MPRPKRKAVSDSAVKAKRAKGETDLPDNLKWSHVGDAGYGNPLMIVLSSDSLKGATKVAGFDIDFTVIKTASGRKFAIGSNDWEFWDESVPGKLRNLDEDGYRIIFFTNQAGIEKQKVTPDVVKRKIEAIIADLNIPVLVFISAGTNQYRKPSTFMWDYFVENCNNGQKLDLSKSVYVGDAAGRAKAWEPGKPKDFSCSDRMFATNIGIDFHTPEEFFLGEKEAPFTWGSVDPQKVITINKKRDVSRYVSKKPEMVIMVGFPASGKSSFCRQYLEPKNYTIVNRDTLKTMDKCAKAAAETLKSGKSVVIDNTNPSTTARSDFIQVAKKQGVPCRCFWMKTSLELAHHLNYVRMNQTNGKVRRVPDVGYGVFKKNFEAPTKAEGFSDVLEVDFVPEFQNKRHETLFSQWTTGGH
ncbi:hypothetical protein ScPMuIL_007055 [Solemya velum]